MGLHRRPDRHQGNNFTPTVLTTQIKLPDKHIKTPELEDPNSPVSSLKNRVLNQTLGTRDTVGPGGSSRKAGARQGGRNATPTLATAEPGKGRSRLASVRCDSKTASVTRFTWQEQGPRARVPRGYTQAKAWRSGRSHTRGRADTRGSGTRGVRSSYENHKPR